MRLNRFTLWSRVCSSTTRMLASAFAVVFLLAACSGGDDSSDNSTAKARTTVLVYMVASDLEENFGGATSNLQEMMKVGSSNDLNIIVETGGARKEGWTTVKRQRVLNGKMEVIKDLGSQDMTKGENLRSFIEWGVETYPAESYHLVFWDHGGGPLGGFGVDTNYSLYDTMPTPTMIEAIKGAQRTTGVKLDLVGFDACLMASAEIAYLLQPSAHYLVASEDVEPGAGWDWEPYLRHLADNPDSNAVSAGKAIIDGYVVKMENSFNNMITLSLVDLSKMPALMDSLNDMAATVLSKLNHPDAAQSTQSWADFAYVRRTSHDFQTSWFYNNATDLVDIGDFVTKPQLAMLDVTDDQIQTMQKALEDAVIYNRFGSRLWQASGLTLYSPLVSVKPDSSNPYVEYETLAMPDKLKGLVKRYGDIANSPDLPKPGVETPQFVGDIAYTPLVNPAFSAQEFFNLWNSNDPAPPVHLAIKPLDAQVPDGVAGNLAADSTDGWFQVPSADGASVLVSVLPDDMPRMAVGYAQYQIPVYYPYPNSDQGTKGVLLVDFNETDTGDKSYRITGFLGYQDASPYASRTEPAGLPAGMVFHPMVFTTKGWVIDKSRKIVSFDVGNEDTPEEGWWQLETVESTTLCGSTCTYSFGVVDYSGTMTW